MGAEERVLVTRPRGQADALLDSLSEAGLTGVHLPLIDIEIINPLPGEARQKILDLDRYEHVFFVSANAARIGAERIEDLWPQWPARQRYWAVGTSTAAVLEAAGLRVERPETDMSSEGLLAMPGLQQLSGQRCLLVRGEGGRTMIAETLRARGAGVDELPCYRRRAVEHTPDEVKALLGPGGCDLVLISSGEGLELLGRLLHPGEGTTLAGTTLIVPSQRVAESAIALGWPRVETADNASDAAMLAAVKRLRQQRSLETQH
ncbi:MAG: uroporphyrinogen-III synthase [Halieaceae bacterium]|jgi:uroporphyrinogen-III synthase|nr:uroporphyrinogen-III synthase [Halieaceae bacterium]